MIPVNNKIKFRPYFVTKEIGNKRTQKGKRQLNCELPGNQTTKTTKKKKTHTHTHLAVDDEPAFFAGVVLGNLGQGVDFAHFLEEQRSHRRLLETDLKSFFFFFFACLVPFTVQRKAVFGLEYFNLRMRRDSRKRE